MPWWQPLKWSDQAATVLDKETESTWTSHRNTRPAALLCPYCNVQMLHVMLTDVCLYPPWLRRDINKHFPAGVWICWHYMTAELKHELETSEHDVCYLSRAWIFLSVCSSTLEKSWWVFLTLSRSWIPSTDRLCRLTGLAMEAMTRRSSRRLSACSSWVWSSKSRSCRGK